MKIFVNNECIGCNVCCDEQPKVFQLKDGKAAIVGTDVEEVDVEICAGLCPVSAISYSDD